MCRGDGVSTLKDKAADQNPKAPQDLQTENEQAFTETFPSAVLQPACSPS